MRTACTRASAVTSASDSVQLDFFALHGTHQELALQVSQITRALRGLHADLGEVATRVEVDASTPAVASAELQDLLHRATTLQQQLDEAADELHAEQEAHKATRADLEASAGGLWVGAYTYANDYRTSRGRHVQVGMADLPAVIVCMNLTQACACC